MKSEAVSFRSSSTVIVDFAQENSRKVASCQLGKAIQQAVESRGSQLKWE